MEFGLSGMGVMSALAILLADGNGSGGGDLFSDNPVIGSWRGDRIVVAGDYSDIYVKGTDKNIYDYAHKNFKNVSSESLAALLDDGYYKTKNEERLKSSLSYDSYKKALEFQKTYKNNGKKIKV